MNSINFYSYPFIAAIIMLVLLGARGFTKIAPARWLATVALGFALAAGWWIMRPSQSEIPVATELEAAFNSGKPVLIEFQSPF